MAKTHLSLPAESGAAAGGENGAPVNGYLEGPFAPVKQEMTIYDLQVTGEIPKDLNGRFLRVGSNPNPFDPEDPRTYNWFTGSGMIMGVRLRDGKALWYCNRFVRDDKITSSLGLPRLPGPEVISRKPPYSEKRGPRFVEANVSQTHVFAVNGRTYSFAEGGVLPIEVSYELESVARCDFGETLFVPMSPHSAEDDGWLITSVIDMPAGSSEVLIYHAQDLLGGPVARIHIPHRHNAGFHGNWIPDSEIEAATGPL
jgi:carotenoid cleavage dioxygenase